MCGICGIIHSDREHPVAPRTIERMKASIAHRGPDDHGTQLQDGVGLGLRLPLAGWTKLPEGFVSALSAGAVLGLIIGSAAITGNAIRALGLIWLNAL